jgi:hypothetical protein
MEFTPKTNYYYRVRLCHQWEDLLFVLEHRGHITPEEFDYVFAFTENLVTKCIVILSPKEWSIELQEEVDTLPLLEEKSRKADLISILLYSVSKYGLQATESMMLEKFSEILKENPVI